MTYFEIMRWLEEHLVSFTMQLNGLYKLEYLDDEGYTETRNGISLEGLVLGINNTYLIN